MIEFWEQGKIYLEESLKGKSPWWRSLFLLWSLLILKFIFQNEPIPGLDNPLWVVSHGIHEIGHWIPRPFGDWVSIASGSIFQFFFPFVFVVGMLKHRDPHGASLLLTWQGASCLNMAHYAGPRSIRIWFWILPIM